MWITLIVDESFSATELKKKTKKVFEKFKIIKMLTKEYRIAMPLTVKEYQIGQVKCQNRRIFESFTDEL